MQVEKFDGGIEVFSAKEDGSTMARALEGHEPYRQPRLGIEFHNPLALVGKHDLISIALKDK